MLIRRDIHDRTPSLTWGRGRVTLLGDFIHAMQPNMGQGGCMAIEDSYQLALELSKTWKQRVESGTAIDIVSSLRRSEKSENFPESSVVVPAKEVSKMHAQISYKDGAFFIVDLQIEYVMNHGGRRSRVPPNFPTGLRPSDVIEFGSDKKAEKEWAGILQVVRKYMDLPFFKFTEQVSMESHVPINQNETWTEETHVHLNSIEAWFVCTMLQSNDCYNLRLNRHLPDSFDYTLDCKPRTKHSTAGMFDLTVIWWRSNIEKFHLYFKECTITLEDITLQLGLPINSGYVITDSSWLCCQRNPVSCHKKRML
ncbi:hypothetical protein Goklo_008106 [Gossypium klotzschianum]|uniref:Zeaxanthin epoxidase, chloroplastic n=1 Tax=Gossypium klotzschianum TaxID=34286 RepID=A0A7J8UYN6_9ROSI|nr:hypothetical protein [Gossypium klotzschianum]